MIAIAMSCNPQLLIADEPTTALDVTIQAQVLDLLKSLLQKLNTAVIIITHDLGVVANIAQKVLVMYGGIIVESGKRREIVVNGHEGVQAYDPASGHELWFCKSFNGRGEPTVTPAGGLLCVANGLAGDFYSVRPGGKGDVTQTHMAWHTPRQGGRDCPSPIVVGEFIIVCDMSGIATCYDAADGHVYWKNRLNGRFSGSPIAAGGLVYLVNEAGKTVVIKPGPTFEVVAENELSAGKEEIFRASPACPVSRWTCAMQARTTSSVATTPPLWWS